MMRGNLQLSLGNFTLDSGYFELPLSGITVLFGRSGSGKTTLLRAISGLDINTRGQLKVNDEIWQQGRHHLPPQARHIGFVFQEAALFPHLTVRQNLLYGLKRLPKTCPVVIDFTDIVQRTNLGAHLDRNIHFLSGGERQRVAIARALLMHPKLLCMDEPLSALDWRAKHELLTLLEELIAAYHIPTLYITHSPKEVERLADRIIFMRDGHIETIETLPQALTRPDSPLFDEQGAVSVLFGHPQPFDLGLQPVRIGEDTLWLSDILLTHLPSVRIRILARDVSLARSDPRDLSIINHLKTTILELIPQGDYRLLVRLQLKDGQHLFSEITRQSAERLNLHPTQPIYALIKSVAVTA